MKISSFTMYSMLVLLVCATVVNKGEDDEIQKVPGYGADAPRVFAGHLNSKNNASLHYVLVASAKGLDSSDPITLWVSNSPGCSSKIAMLAEIGPFLLPPGVEYNSSVDLVPNPYSWHKLSNLLFIDSPQGTGYSLMPDSPYILNDQNAADDTFSAIVDFFTNSFPTLQGKYFYIAGSGYAGKFIPDVVLRINNYNMHAEIPINLRGIMVGNGVMDLADNQLEKSQIDYMFSRNFVDPTLSKYWEGACQVDPASAGCAFFLRRYDDLLAKINVNSIYGQCYKDPVRQILEVQKTSLSGFVDKKAEYYNNFVKCQARKGIDQYFQTNYGDFRGKNQLFVSCNQTLFESYTKTEDGSMNEYARLLTETTTRILFFSGDWDDIVPYPYTIKHLGRLGMREIGGVRYWINSSTQQHIGFKRSFLIGQREIKLWIVKGAGSAVAREKPNVGYELFEGFLANQQ